MTIENILAMVAIAVITNFILNFKGFCENIDYIKTRVGRDKELTGTWSEQGHVDSEDLGLTSSGFELHLSTHCGIVSGYFSSMKKSGILCEGRWIWWKQDFSKFYTFTFIGGKRVVTGEFTMKLRDGYILVIDGFLEHEETVVLAKKSDECD